MPSTGSNLHIEMSRQTQQNLLFSLFITALGMMINIFNTVADRIALSLGRAASDAGLFISIYALGSLTSLVLSSSLADHVGKRRVIIGATTILTAGFAIMFVSHAFLPIAIGLFLFGVGFGPAEGMASAVLSDENPEQASKWVNIAHSGFGLGAILGPMFAIAVVQLSGSHHQVFLYSGIIAAVFVFFIALTAKHPQITKEVKGHSPFSMFEVLKDRRMAVLALMMFLYLGYESVAATYTKLLFIASGESETMGAFMISLFWGSMIVARLIGASLTGKEVISIRVFAAIAVTGILIMVIAPVTWLRVVGVVLYGFGCGPTWPMLVVLATQLFPERSGSAIGMMMISTMGGITVFPSLIGTLPGNLTATFLLTATLAALVMLLSFKAGHDKKQEPA
ncbi:MAG: MFS transporter [Christensenellales bacterium]|nr:MFS transporter [Clostridiales bacterium]